MANLPFPAVQAPQTSLIIGCGRNTVPDYYCKPGTGYHRLAGINQYEHLCPPNINMTELPPPPEGDYQDGGVRARFCYTISDDPRANAHIQDTFLSRNVADFFAAQQPPVRFDLVYWDHAGNLLRPAGMAPGPNYAYQADQAVNRAWGLVRPGGLLVLSCVGFEERCTTAAGQSGNPLAQWEILNNDADKTAARNYLNGLPAQLGLPAANAREIWSVVRDAAGHLKAANDAAAVGDIRMVDGIALRKL